MKFRKYLPVLQFQLGGLLDTTFGVQPINAPIQGINPGVQNTQLNTQALNVQPFFQGQQLAEQRANRQLNEDKFDFEKQKELFKLNKDFFDSVNAATKSLSGLKQDNFGLTPGYLKNDNALSQAYAIQDDTLATYEQMMQGVDASDIATLQLQANRLKHDSLRKIELETDIIKEGIIDKKWQAMLTQIEKQTGTGKKLVNSKKFAEALKAYEGYKNSDDPTAVLDQNIFEASQYIFDQESAVKRLDKLTETITQDLTNVELLAKGLGLPRNVIGLVTTAGQTDEKKAAILMAEAIKRDPEMMNYLETSGLDVDQYAQAQVAARQRGERQTKIETKDFRIKSSGSSSKSDKSAVNLKNREALLDELRVGERTGALVGRIAKGSGQKTKKITDAQYLPAGGTQDVPTIRITYEGPDKTPDGSGNTAVEFVTEDILLTKKGLERINDLLNQGIPGGDQVVSDQLNDWFKRFQQGDRKTPNQLDITEDTGTGTSNSSSSGNSLFNSVMGQ